MDLSCRGCFIGMWNSFHIFLSSLVSKIWLMLWELYWSSVVLRKENKRHIEMGQD